MTVEEIYRRARTVVLPGLTCFSISALVCKLYAGVCEASLTRWYCDDRESRPARPHDRRPDQSAVQEARERVKPAIRNASLKFPQRRVTANLAPSKVPRGGRVST